MAFALIFYHGIVNTLLVFFMEKFTRLSCWKRRLGRKVRILEID